MEWTRDTELRSATVQELTGGPVQEGKSGPVSVSLKVSLRYRPYLIGPPHPCPRNTIVAVFYRGRRPGVSALDEQDRIKLGQFYVPWDERTPYQPPFNPDPRLWHREIPDSWTTEWPALADATFALPPLWRGRYPLCCTVHQQAYNGPVGTPGKEIPLAAFWEGALVVAPDPQFPRVDNHLPLEMTNLFAVVPDPTVTFVETADGKIPFTLKHAGYPVLDLHGFARPGTPTFTAAEIAAAIIPVVRAIENSIQQLPMHEQIFSPVYRVDAEAVRDRAEVEAAVRSKSWNQSLACQAAGASAASRPKDPTVNYGLAQATQTGLRALQWDPENPHAYLWVARCNALRGETYLAFDFFLTLIFRLRLAERILTNPPMDPGGRLRGQVIRALPTRIGPDFWPTLTATAKLLHLHECMNLNFPNVAKAALK